MTESNPAASNKVAVSFWVIGVLSLLWNAGGAYDYLMTQTRDATYMANFTPEQLDFFYGFPAWLIAAWAIAVWGGVLGSICLLLRRALAVPIFLASFIAMALTAVHNYILSDGLQVIGGGFELVFTALIFIIALALYLYSKAKRAAGVLR